MSAKPAITADPAAGDLDERLVRHALRLAVLDLRADQAVAEVSEARLEAVPDFAIARNRGIRQISPTLPDGTETGLISIQAGARTVAVDEDLLLLCAAPGDLETYVTASALADERVIKLIDEYLPELVERRIRPKVRAEFQAELEEHDGVVRNRVTNDPEKVAEITAHPATGRFSYKAGKLAAGRIAAAIEAGLITESGEIRAPVTAPADVAPAAPAAPAPAAPQAAAITSTPAAPRPSRARKGSTTPTGEQGEIIEAFRGGGNLVAEAGAGTGKTSTMVMCAEADPARTGCYVSYNAAIASDARRKFPSSVKCSTAHALAMAAVGYEYRDRLNGPRVPAREQAKILRIPGPLKAGDKILAPERMARLAMETVERFCKSADDQVTRWHVPRKPGLGEGDDALHAELAAQVLPFARRAWDDLRGHDGKLKFDHGCYLKIWQLSRPEIHTDFIFFDEAQDASPVILDVVVRQTDSQLVAVGDRNQAINGWTGAVNAMDKFPADTRLALSQSFRFGSAIAREANKWLSVLGADLRLTGFDRISSMVRTLELPEAVLCRTNAQAMAEAMAAMEAGRKAAIVGGGDAIRALAEAAVDLKSGRGTSHPKLFAFTSWAEVQDHAENDAAGSDLRVLVQLIDEHGPEKIIAMAGALADEKTADVTISTAHKAKGREWNSVRIAGDFREPRRDPERPDLPAIPDDLAMLAYVAVTRARLSLDRTGLAWVDHYLPGGGTDA